MNIRQILFICATSVGSLACAEQPSFINQLEDSFLQRSCGYWANQPNNDSGQYLTKYPSGRREEALKACAELNIGLVLVAFGNKDLNVAQLTDDELREKITMVVGPQGDEIINLEVEKYKTLRERLQNHNQHRRAGMDPRVVKRPKKSREIIDTKQ